MPHSRTAKKNLRKSLRRRAANKSALSAMRTEIKKLRTALSQNDVAGAQAQYRRAQKLLDKNSKRNRIHANKASRLKARLAKAIAKAAQ